MMKQDKPPSRRAKWLEKLANYQFEVEHRPGMKMQHADYLSRIENVETLTKPQDRKDATYVMIVMYHQNGIFMSQRHPDVKTMPGLLQTICEKVEEEETSYEAAKRKM